MKINLSINIIRFIFDASKRYWQNETLRDLIDLANGKSLIKRHMVEEGEYPVFGANGLLDGPIVF